jgi:hypothetical protein
MIETVLPHWMRMMLSVAVEPTEEPQASLETVVVRTQ